MRKLPKTISEKEFIDVFKTIQSRQLRLAFSLGFYQCMRVSEVVNLKHSDMDRERGFLHIIGGKGGKDRDIPITPPLIKQLRHLPIKLGIRSLQLYTKRYWPDIHFHTLRHSGATYYLNDKGLDIRFIQQLLGHSRLDTTQIYTHISPRQLKTAFDNVW